MSDGRLFAHTSAHAGPNLPPRPRPDHGDEDVVNDHLSIRQTSDPPTELEPFSFIAAKQDQAGLKNRSKSSGRGRSGRVMGDGTSVWHFPPQIEDLTPFSTWRSAHAVH
ncbi:hypothetical protein J6590_063782 [Homalodisca vitripennis]|nr:hypothetical protein J6590_063782 [Homalodisca vitripennis]